MNRLITLISAFFILGGFISESLAQIRLTTPSEIVDHNLITYENKKGKVGYKVTRYPKSPKTYIKACFDEADKFIRIKNSQIDRNNDLLLATVRFGSQWLIIDNSARIRYISKNNAPKPIIDEFVHYIAEDINGEIKTGNAEYTITKVSDNYICTYTSEKTQKNEPALIVVHQDKETDYYDTYQDLIPEHTYLTSKITYNSNGKEERRYFLLDSTFNVTSKLTEVNTPEYKQRVFLKEDRSGFALIKDKIFPIKFTGEFSAHNNYLPLVDSTKPEELRITLHDGCYTHHKNDGTHVLYTKSGKIIGTYDYESIYFEKKRDNIIITTNKDGKSAYGLIDLNKGYMVTPIIPNYLTSGRFPTTAGYDIIISSHDGISYLFSNKIVHKNIITISEYDERLYNRVIKKLSTLITDVNNSCPSELIRKATILANIYFNDTILKNDEKSHYKEIQGLLNTAKARVATEEFKKMNIFQPGHTKFVNKGNRDEEYEMIDGNYYTYKIKGNNGFLIRECEVLNKKHFIFDFDGKYIPLKIDSQRDTSSIIIPFEEFINNNILEYNDLILQKFYCEQNNIFLIYDYKITRSVRTGTRFYDIVNVVPNPATGKLEYVYGWKYLTEKLDESQRFVSIVNQDGVKKTFSIPRSGYIHRKGDNIVIVDHNNVMSIDFYTGDINLLYNNEDGTRIYDVGRTTDGKYVCVGSTTNKGHIGSQNPYIILLDQNGKKLHEIHIADKDMKISKISHGDKSEEFIITCSNKPAPSYPKNEDNIEMTEWYEDEEHYRRYNYYKILRINSDNTMTFVEPDYIVGSYISEYWERGENRIKIMATFTFYGNGKFGDYSYSEKKFKVDGWGDKKEISSNSYKGTYTFDCYRIRLKDGKYTFDGLIRLKKNGDRYEKEIEIKDNTFNYHDERYEKSKQSINN